MFIKTDSPLPVGALISIPIQVGKEQAIELQGRVVWSRRGTAGELPASKGAMGVELSAAPEEFLRFVARMRSQLAVAPRALEERFDVYHRVRFKTGEAFLTEYTENLSRGGMFLATDQPLEPGALIRAQLEIHGIDEPIEIEGRVAYRLDPRQAEERGRSAGLGIQFIDLNPEARAKLDHYMRRLETHRSRPERRLVGSVPPSGTLKDFLVPELLLGLFSEKRTGTLLIERKGVTKLVYVKDGHPVYVDSSLRNESLGHYLVRQGKITPMDLEESLAELAQTDLHHGEIMVQGGMIDSATLATAFVEHQEEKLLNMFPWFEGRFEFIPGTDWPPTISILPLQTLQIVFKGIPRWYDATLITAWMGLDEETAIRQVKTPDSEDGIPDVALKVLRRSTTPQTIRKLAVKMEMPVSEILPVVYTLVIAGFAVLDFSNVADVSQPEFRMLDQASKKPASAAPMEDSGKVLELLRRWINEDFERLRHLDFYQLFGVSPSASEAEITRAHMERVSRYEAHDVESIDDPEVREKIKQIRTWLKLAFDTLRDPTLRQLYSRREKKGKEGTGQAAKEGEAERLLIACIRDLEQENIEKAVSGLTLAMQVYPNDPSVPGYLGWALFQKSRKENIERACQLLDQAILKDPSDPQLRYYRGEICAYLNDWRRAERHFSQAVRLHPQFVKAKVALDLAREKRITQEQLRA